MTLCFVHSNSTFLPPSVFLNTSINKKNKLIIMLCWWWDKFKYLSYKLYSSLKVKEKQGWMVEGCWILAGWMMTWWDRCMFMNGECRIKLGRKKDALYRFIMWGKIFLSHSILPVVITNGWLEDTHSSNHLFSIWEEEEEIQTISCCALKGGSTA